MKRVVVVGSGVIGLTAAYALQKRGAEVTVIDSHPGSHGASVVNAGWICPSLSEPVPAPGLVTTSLKWMRHSDSPLYIKPSLDFDFIKWLFSFWRHCNSKHFRYATEAMAHLNTTTFSLYDEMTAAGVAFESHASGILFVFRSALAMEHELEEVHKLGAIGIGQPKPMYGRELHEFEPALSDSINAGFWHEIDRSARPDSLTDGLREWLSERGVTFMMNTRVLGFDVVNGQVNATRTEDGPVAADAVLLAAGAHTGVLARSAGVRLPIQGGKGYCLDYVPAPVDISRPLDFAESRFACTPFDGMVRLAGTMELSGLNEIVRPERAAALARAASRGLREFPADPTAPRVRTGLRPMTPDGLPVIGWLPGYRNFAVATGHGMLGLTLAASTGDHVAEMITSGTTPPVLEPFDPSRYA